MSTDRRCSSGAGFTLIEVLIAIGIFVYVCVGVAQIVALATRATRQARERTTTPILAAAKMDQLRALAWTYEPQEPGIAPLPRSDFTTNVAAPSFPADGPGLRPSPPDTLTTSTPFYVDYLDDGGRWVGNDVDPPPEAVFVRRWAVR